MAELKTKQTDASVADYLDGIEPAGRREDTRAVVEMMQRVTGWQPKMWGDSMVGFGAYEYTTGSGHSGRWFITGVAPRKTALTVYIMPGFEKFPELMERLGQYKTGKSCLYLKKLDDVDQDALAALIGDSVDLMQDWYSWAEA